MTRTWRSTSRSTAGTKVAAPSHDRTGMVTRWLSLGRALVEDLAAKQHLATQSFFFASASAVMSEAAVVSSAGVSRFDTTDTNHVIDKKNANASLGSGSGRYCTMPIFCKYK